MVRKTVLAVLLLFAFFAGVVRKNTQSTNRGQITQLTSMERQIVNLLAKQRLKAIIRPIPKQRQLWQQRKQPLSRK